MMSMQARTTLISGRRILKHELPKQRPASTSTVSVVERNLGEKITSSPSKESSLCFFALENRFRTFALPPEQRVQVKHRTRLFGFRDVCVYPRGNQKKADLTTPALFLVIEILPRDDPARERSSGKNRRLPPPEFVAVPVCLDNRSAAAVLVPYTPGPTGSHEPKDRRSPDAHIRIYRRAVG